MLTALSFLVAPQSACACSCAVGTEQEFVDWADLIFVGVVTAMDKPLGIGGGGDVKVTFAVESVVKGQAGTRKTIKTADSSASCGFDFSVGHRFKVYSKDGQTGLCSGNKTLGAAPEVPVDSPFPFGWVALGGGVLVAGLIAYVLHRRRRL